MKKDRISSEELFDGIDWAQYLNAVWFTDVQVGRVMDRLERDGGKERPYSMDRGEGGLGMDPEPEEWYDCNMKWYLELTGEDQELMENIALMKNWPLKESKTS